MRKLKTFLFTILLTSTFLYANEPLPELTIAQDSINSFETKLYQMLSETEGNVNYSAISIYSLLYALQKGAQGTTKDQINQVIDLSPSQDADSQLKTIITGTENMTNSLWYKKTLTIQNDYKAFTKNYDFIIKPTDFYNGPKVRKEINSFISKQTDKLIENFLQDDLPLDTQFVLLNTLYFNQKWQKKFDKHDTKDRTFYISKNQEVQIPMMCNTTSLRYYEDLDFQAVELVYEDSRYSMIVFLPRDYDFDFTRLDPNMMLEKFSEQKNRKSVAVYFPKFDITSKYDLIPVFEKFGMTDAFNPAVCDLSQIFTQSQDIYVDAAIHQVRIMVSETETKAAAVTMFASKATAYMPEDPVIFKADHPFLYVIRDNELGINLFTGIVREPK